MAGANAGEVSVELRLVLDKLAGDIAKAAQAMKAGLTVNDVDIFEINEAFAS